MTKTVLYTIRIKKTGEYKSWDKKAWSTNTKKIYFYSSLDRAKKAMLDTEYCEIVKFELKELV